MERSGSPLFNDNRFKLGVFCFNVSHGTTMTMAEGTLTPTWEENVRIARAADDAGWEFLLPLGRWKGLGGRTNFNSRSFEVYTWAAAISAMTKQIQVFATSHVPIFHPVISAKQGTTIDHVSGGRFALNVVAGWNNDEIGMFAGRQLPHDERYDAADEWVTIVKRLWTEEEEFDFDGKYYQIKKAYAMPKPLQQPHPVIVNAGSSPAGMRFGAKHADLSFQTDTDLEAFKKKNETARRLAWDEWKREIGIIAHGLVICRDTEQEAQDYVRYCFDEHGDREGAQQLVEGLIAGDMQSRTPEDLRQRMARNLMMGWGGYRLIGTPEQVVSGMQQLADVGVNGIALHWVDYEAGITQFNERVLPLMVQAGLRTR